MALTLENIPTIAGMLKPETLEWLGEELADPGANLPAGASVHLSEELKVLAAFFRESGENQALNVVQGGVGASAVWTDEGVVFTYKAATTRTTLDEPNFRHQHPEADFDSLYAERKINMRAVRRAFPPGDFPDKWERSPVDERVEVKL